MNRRSHSVRVVLDDENDRELEQGRHVERFIEGADVGDRIAQEAKTYGIAVSIADRISNTSG